MSYVKINNKIYYAHAVRYFSEGQVAFFSSKVVLLSYEDLKKLAIPQTRLFKAYIRTI